MIRRATQKDTPQLTGLIADFYAEVPYDTPVINVEQTRAVLDAYINAPEHQAFIEVIDMESLLVGFMIGERTPDLWTDAIRTVEVALYVNPAFRGRPAAGRLLLNFAKWAEEVPGIIRVEASSGITDANAAQVYQKLGWGSRGTLHGMEAY